MLGTLRRDPMWLALALASLAILGGALVWPLVSMLGKSFVGDDGSFGLAGYARFFSERGYREVFHNTVILGFVVTCTSMLLGGALAALVARFTFRLA
ncbi:MAG TPA: iron ABC transporter permease, partial [Burkholderiaceae bacterium]|nr:iron ABC transporter permease [Burkholderiaceae bacterium]